MWIVTLRPLGAVAPELHSDTLFGCLCWAAKYLKGVSAVRGWLEAFDAGRPPFVLSSAFPFVEDEEGKTYFFPRPRHWPPPSEPKTLEQYRASKKQKKIRWVCRETFLRIVGGEWTTEPGRKPPALTPRPVLHNRINRITWGTTEPGRLYYEERVFGPTDGGYYFLLDVRDQSSEDLLRGAIHLLGHIGWGGDTSRGVNHFRTSIEEAPRGFLPQVENPTHFVTLSLYYPKPSERQLFAEKEQVLWYELEWRRGKVGGRFYPSPRFWKRAVNYFAEGSVLPLPSDASETLGRNPVVKEMDGMVIRSYGIAFVVPAKLTTGVNG